MDQSEKAYLHRLTKHPHVVLWKLVKVAQGEDWYPNWEDDHVLVVMEKMPLRPDTYNVYCCGQDDCMHVIRNLDYKTAKNLFVNAAKDGISKEQLTALGIVRE